MEVVPLGVPHQVVYVHKHPAAYDVPVRVSYYDSDEYFQPEHAYQVETIPGIKDMIAKYK